MKRIIACLLLLCCLVSLCSCLGATSLEKYGYVLTLGVDKGSVYKYNISFLLENQSEQSEQGGKPMINVVSAEGDNIFDAIHIAETGLPYQLNFSRTNYIIVGYGVAEKNDIMELFSTSWAKLKVRTSANMVVAMGTAREFMDGMDYAQEVNITKLENSLIELYKTEGLTTIMSITEFMVAATSNCYDAVVPLGCTDSTVGKDEQKDTTGGVKRQGGMKSYTLGAALFSGSRLCGCLSGLETQALLLIRGELDEVAMQFVRADGTNYTVLIGNAGKPRVDLYLSENSINADYRIRLKLTLSQDNSVFHIKEMRKTGGISKEMQEQIREFLANSCLTLSQNVARLNCDAFGIGKLAVMQFDTVKGWERFDFNSRKNRIFCNFNFEFEVEDVYVSTYME